jgi:hypothetical protein
MNKKILSFLILATVLVVPIAVSAQTLGGMAAAIAGQVVIVGTWIVVIMWVVTGILFLTTAGDPAKLKLARNGLFACIGGTILVILANSAIAFVANSFGL